MSDIPQALAGRLRHVRVTRELNRLNRLDRMLPAKTTLPGCPFSLIDGPAFVSQWRAIFEQEHYAFTCESDHPRILDCGANIGLASLYWVRRIPSARITAFEPDPILATLLRSNLNACQASQVDVVEAAVWRENGELDFAGGSPDAGRIRPGRTGTSVAAVRLRDYLKQPVALLKLDIEGAEVEVLRDCAADLDAVALAFVEFHSFEDEPQQLHEGLSILAESGFRIHVVSQLASPRPFVRRETYLGMDQQLSVYAYRASARR
jgi:FkbM family methyltransferase